MTTCVFDSQNNLNHIEAACVYIGVDMADFNLRNEMFSRPQHEPIHGIGHIYRTMIGCAVLGVMLQKPREALLAFCGAYIHDLARRDDGVEYMHGSDATLYKFPLYAALWDKYSLSEKEREWVCQAVSQHSTKEWMKVGDEGYDVMAILKDADALDRCRIGDLNPAMLRYAESRELINIIEYYCINTIELNEDIEFKEFISCCI